ncbi:hypothetical protein D910_11916 [Dendroctonus ponderosae]|uniref:Amino acid permease/ SLC12A domain-containing protein n=1 Tax=Dendroctonus ponderosae TaxID=77166 RepID=U4UWG7_DENPD|nr:hypothetical protein D910_11916 [Dendroctonus ponderosae]
MEGSSRGDSRNKDIDWSKYGLGNETAQRVRANTSGFVDLSSEGHYAAGGHQASGANELFAEEQILDFLLFEIFEFSGGIGKGMATALVSVLSAVGICERCRIESGGVYFVLGHVLGSRVGGSLGLLYCFGQAVGCALNVLGFGESMAELIGFGDSGSAVRLIAIAAVLLLSCINIAGVKWVIKLQFILLLILLLAGLDFMVGSFVHSDEENGFEGWISENMQLNLQSNYTEGYGMFAVFGVFFPTITGILAGINMSGDLKAPSTNIPNGTLAAISFATFLYLVFILFLGATCTRKALQADYMIAAKVSAIGVLFLAGLYVSSMSSCLGAMYGTPRVLQSIALENVIPGIGILGMGRGPNKVPLYSMAVVATVTFAFILIGNINTLAPIVTMPYLLTYACIDYSYFALAQTFDIQHQREQRFHRPRIQATISVDSDSNDLDRLFPERTRHKNLRGESSSNSSPSSPAESSETTPIAPKTHIHSKQKNWYSHLCNRWLSLFGVSLIKDNYNVLGQLDVCSCMLFSIWLYIGTANPAVKPGLASEFHFFHWLKSVIFRCFGRRVTDYEQIIVTPVHPGLDVSTAQLNEDNEDFSNRRRYHQSATVTGHMVDIDD